MESRQLQTSNMWELIFTQVTGPPRAQIIADFSHLRKEKETIYSLRLTSNRNDASRWICLNAKEIDWLCKNIDVQAAGRSFSHRHRAIEVRKYLSDKLTIIRISQKKNKRVCAITFPLFKLSCITDYVVAADLLIKLKTVGWKKIYGIEDLQFRHLLMKSITYYYINKKLSEIDEYEDDSIPNLAKDIIKEPNDLKEVICCIFKYFNLDEVVPSFELEPVIVEVSENISESYCLPEMDQNLCNAVSWMLDVKLLDNNIPVLNDDITDIGGIDVGIQTDSPDPSD